MVIYMYIVFIVDNTRIVFGTKIRVGHNTIVRKSYEPVKFACRIGNVLAAVVSITNVINPQRACYSSRSVCP